MSGPSHFVELKAEEFLKESLDIVERGRSRGAHLRVLGALAVYVNSLDNAECIQAFTSLDRLGEGKPFFTDLDLAAYGKQKKEVTKIFQELSFRPDQMVNALFGDKRLIFYHPQNKYQVDVFLNKLEFSHDVLFGSPGDSGRLELDYPTITLADIVLEKLQIHEINHKDLADLAVLFLGHEVRSEQSKRVVDGGYIAKTLARDWGFWYDATTNLSKARSFVNEKTSSGRLTPSQSQVINVRIQELNRMIENSPKSNDWLKRSKTGTKKAWYKRVDEVVR